MIYISNVFTVLDSIFFNEYLAVYFFANLNNTSIIATPAIAT